MIMHGIVHQLRPSSSYSSVFAVDAPPRWSSLMKIASSDTKASSNHARLQHLQWIATRVATTSTGPNGVIGGGVTGTCAMARLCTTMGAPLHMFMNNDIFNASISTRSWFDTITASLSSSSSPLVASTDSSLSFVPLMINRYGVLMALDITSDVLCPYLIIFINDRSQHQLRIPLSAILVTDLLSPII